VGSKDKGRPPKSAPKSPPKSPKARPKASADETDDDRKSARRVALMRNKLTAAMEDPLTRSQIVAAIRAMMKGSG
jgi:hypothetical protein